MDDLKMLQSLPLDVKILKTKQRIKEWINEYGEDGVYISFSGGKDSTVLLDLVRQDYPDVKACFVDVPTQFPELKQFVETFDNVDIVRPKMNFFQVCEKYGFPLISKEVAECVEGARRFVRESLTDRQTDICRIDIGTKEFVAKENIQNFQNPLMEVRGGKIRIRI